MESLNVTVIIPSLNPDEHLPAVVSALRGYGFSDIVLVNDGSNAESSPYFPEGDGIALLTHETNLGKGRALKTAFAYIKENRPDTLGVVTVDGDNQHRAEDVYACARAMLNSGKLILGSRDFSSPNVPNRSRRGNRITCAVFRVCCGLKISDTQTGLRAIPIEYLPKLMEVKGERYEYETNMLLEAKPLEIPLGEVKISTVYIEGNKSSHFNAFRDSIRIYTKIVKFMLSSAAAAIIDNAAFLMFALALGQWRYSITASLIAARVISSICNFIINKKLVFGNKKSVAGTISRYYILAAGLILCDALFLNGISMLTGVKNDAAITAIKIIIDTGLFLVSFPIQREWVFK
ncbi:dolichol-phosphate mannosyltransferase [Clostridia bacterium]|nr:dolichol-phosphate mannosyltransferase [Clostridia bacterium]